MNLTIFENLLSNKREVLENFEIWAQRTITKHSSSN